ncbi:hypothetical protein T484DRAFT_2756403 [Baffinella frigidus]|nr:hypothetical protein T484DRAFT_2756403 [Cryptophyta sp. CCMP2293]
MPLISSRQHMSSILLWAIPYQVLSAKALLSSRQTLSPGALDNPSSFLSATRVCAGALPCRASSFILPRQHVPLLSSLLGDTLPLLSPQLGNAQSLLSSRHHPLPLPSSHSATANLSSPGTANRSHPGPSQSLFTWRQPINSATANLSSLGKTLPLLSSSLGNTQPGLSTRQRPISPLSEAPCLSSLLVSTPLHSSTPVSSPISAHPSFLLFSPPGNSLPISSPPDNASG